MSTPEATPQLSALTPLPRLEDLPRGRDGGFDPEAVREAFDTFRRHALQMQAQLRVLQAAGKTGNVDPTGHAVRMDALHLLRAAAEFADVLERDAQAASAAQIGRTLEEVRTRQRDLRGREAEIERRRGETERECNELLNAAKNEARELRANASRDSAAELREAEARGARLLEQARHQATELTNAARAEVEQTLDWARAHASAIIARAQEGAEELLTAAGLGPDALAQVSRSIVDAARSSVAASSAGSSAPDMPFPEPRLAAAPSPASETPAPPASEPEASPAEGGEPQATEPAQGDEPE
jgi:F0F1-type ATP synthase membrane subunit b/b'